MATAKKDPEVEAMGAVARALDGLEPEQQGRVLRWAADRYSVTLGGRKIGGAGGNSGSGSETDASQFSDLSDLFGAVAPATDEDRALVIAYWFQELQDEKQPNVSGAQVNKELKHLGHG